MNINIIHKAYKTEIKPNHKQRILLLKNAGAARYAYNWGLNQKKQAIEKKTKIPTAIDLHKNLVVLKQTELSWMYECSKCSPQEALRNLDCAFINFFKKLTKFPRFKSRKNGVGGFRLTGTIKVSSSHIQLPKLGKLKFKERGYIPSNIEIHCANVSERAGRWFVSIQVKEEQPAFNGKKDSHDIVGVDLGIKTLATISDGKIYDNPKPLKIKLKKLKRLQQSVNRKVKGSQNRKKAVKKVVKLHFKISNKRKDALHKITTTLAKTKRVIGIEDLNISGILKNRKLSRAITDLGLFELRRQLEYKGKWYNCKIIVVNRFFPSSKTCSVCNKINENLRLVDREWICESCKTKHDRDFNASVNLEKVAVSLTET